MYVWRKHGQLDVVSSSQPMRGFVRLREATAEEIAAQRQRDAEFEQRRKQASMDARKFRDRPDVKDAEYIAGELDLNIAGVIDNLTPEEWSIVAARIRGEKKPWP